MTQHLPSSFDRTDCHWRLLPHDFPPWLQHRVATHLAALLKDPKFAANNRQKGTAENKATAPPVCAATCALSDKNKCWWLTASREAVEPSHIGVDFDQVEDSALIWSIREESWIRRYTLAKADLAFVRSSAATTIASVL
jgi:hypothetical protein